MEPRRHAVTLERALAYAAMLAVGGGLVWAVCRVGSGLEAPEGPSSFGRAAVSARGQALPQVLLALVVIITVARGVGLVFARFGQPAVLGEILSGILLGPSLLGRVAPGLAHAVLPGEVAPQLEILAQVGVILYMFLVGLGLDAALLRGRGHAALAVSHASIVLPFALGAGLSLLLYPRLSTRDVPFTVFALFMGVSMSVTAFPVLARILNDKGLQHTRIGALALSCAAVDDVTAWCLLAFVVSLVRAAPGESLATFALTAAYLGGMLLLVRPLARRFASSCERRGLTQKSLAVVALALLLSALATERIGIHALFGAFLLGALLPRGSRLARELRERFEDLVLVLLLPAFFAYTGLRTEIGLVQGGEAWALCGLIVLVASFGKFGGSFLAARASGLGWRQAAALGVLMNTRGLMELIVLNVGLDLGVLSPRLFTMMVLMALFTTFATTPALRWMRLERDEPLAAEEGVG